MDDAQYIRKVQTSITNFIHCGDEYLFLHRKSTKRIDANKLNGIGGRVEPGENYLDAALRETREETGYEITAENIELAGVVKLEGGYDEDWVMCFFKTEVHSKTIPLGSQTEDGELIWLHKDKVLDTSYELVDDINYCFKDLVDGKELFFITAQVNKEGKITHASISRLKR